MHQPRLICASPKPYQQNARQNPCAVRTPPASPRPGRYDGSRMRTAPVSRPAMPKQPMRREKHQLHHLTARHLQLSAARPRSPTQLIPGDAPIIGCRPQYPLHREDPPGQRRTAGQTAKGSPQSHRATEAVAPPDPFAFICVHLRFQMSPPPLRSEASISQARQRNRTSSHMVFGPPTSARNKYPMHRETHAGCPSHPSPSLPAAPGRGVILCQPIRWLRVTLIVRKRGKYLMHREPLPLAAFAPDKSRTAPRRGHKAREVMGPRIKTPCTVRAMRHRRRCHMRSPCVPHAYPLPRLRIFDSLRPAAPVGFS